MRSFPFDSLALYQDEKTGLWIGDRQGSAQDVRDINKIFWKNGVCMAFENAFQVTPGEGMNVIVAPGVCGIEGTLGIEDSERGMTLQASSSEDRIDTIVLRLNLNVEARKTDLYVKTGVAQPVPVRPQLTRSESVWELGIADIFVAKNSGAISAARITDTRLQTERCGMMTPLIEVDTTTFYNQLQAAIDERTAELEEQTQIAVDLAQSAIDGTTAGNLQNQITQNKEAEDARWVELSKSVKKVIVPVDFTMVGRGYYVVNLQKVDGFHIESCVLEAISSSSVAATPSAPTISSNGNISMRITNANDASGGFKGNVVCIYRADIQDYENE